MTFWFEKGNEESPIKDKKFVSFHAMRKWYNKKSGRMD